MPSERFIESKNPLPERLGDSFFTDLPSSPGVYKMYGAAGKLLYVGKAKNLRKRLQTYRRAKPGRESRKVIRLVRMIHKIELEMLATEEEALLRENKLIRECRPEFNHAKKQPEAYYYVTLKPAGSILTADLRMHIREEDKEYTYGAFKGHVTVRRGLGALLRQLYIMEHHIAQPFNLPSQLLRKLTPLHYELKMKDLLHSDITDLITSFFEGRSDDFLYCVVRHTERNGLLKSFIGKVVLKDMESLHYFYDRCARRNYEIITSLELKSTLIPQEKLDDYLVQWAFRDQ